MCVLSSVIRRFHKCQAVDKNAVLIRGEICSRRRATSVHNDMAFWKEWKEVIWFGPKDEEDASAQQPKNKKKKKKARNANREEDDETMDDNSTQISKKKFKFVIPNHKLENVKF